jgi:hypothetical protein
VLLGLRLVGELLDLRLVGELLVLRLVGELLVLRLVGELLERYQLWLVYEVLDVKLASQLNSALA